MMNLPRPNVMKESRRWNKHSWMNWLVGLTLSITGFYNKNVYFVAIVAFNVGYALSLNVFDYFDWKSEGKRDEVLRNRKTKTTSMEHA